MEAAIIAFAAGVVGIILSGIALVQTKAKELLAWAAGAVSVAVAFLAAQKF
jgi:hypothetical protein